MVTWFTGLTLVDAIDLADVGGRGGGKGAWRLWLNSSTSTADSGDLHSFTLATIIQIETLRFCRRFLTHEQREAGAKFYDPKGRQYDQMTQAARSGRQNIIEGSERAATSKDTEMKLTDVARASLSELRGDYEILILDQGQLPWSVHSPEAQAVNAISLDPAPFEDDMVHESAKHALDPAPASTPLGWMRTTRWSWPTPCS